MEENLIKYKTKRKLNSGMMSVAYLLDEEYIQLVGKREDAFDAYKDMKDNADLLDGKITCVDYPHNMILIAPNSEYPYGSLIYPIVKGDPLKIDKLNDNQLLEVARKLVEFNKQMHSADIHWDREWAINHELEKVNKNITLLKDYLADSDIEILNKYAVSFANYLYSKKSFCITHGDLWADNLIVDEAGNLTGIIDFGNMAYFLPEVDYASVWDMCDGFLDKMCEFTDENITKESVYLFVMHRELCSFEYVLSADNDEVNTQLDKIKQALELIKPIVSEDK